MEEVRYPTERDKMIVIRLELLKIANEGRSEPDHVVKAAEKFEKFLMKEAEESA